MDCANCMQCSVDLAIYRSRSVGLQLDEHTLMFKVIVQAVTDSFTTLAGLLVTTECSIGCECWTGTVDADYVDH